MGTNTGLHLKSLLKCMKVEQKKKQERPVFPFSGIVGQTEMKLALILNVIDPKIGGVLVMGDRGTGKSTTVRALADLLPEIDVVAGDKFNSDPKDPEGMSDEIREALFLWEQKNLGYSAVLATGELPPEAGGASPVAFGDESPLANPAGPFLVSKMKIPMVDLPLGATEDRVCGTIDIEKALTEGVKAFEPGLLAKANRGILYVDEVNLLDDHLVDVLLDSAASGWNTVEREGISIRHPARFILVGSGNPEEGELRPQLLDRFGMLAQIGTVKEPELRVKIVEQRTAFDQDPEIFLKDFIPSQNELRAKIINARSILPQVILDYELRVNISKICSELNVDGLRGDIVCSRAAKAIAAFDGRTKVTPQDIYQIISLCLRHRLRKDPLESIDSGVKVVEAFSKTFGL